MISKRRSSEIYKRQREGHRDRGGKEGKSQGGHKIKDPAAGERLSCHPLRESAPSWFDYCGRGMGEGSSRNGPNVVNVPISEGVSSYFTTGPGEIGPIIKQAPPPTRWRQFCAMPCCGVSRGALGPMVWTIQKLIKT